MIETKDLMNHLKEIMKMKKITYKEIAQHLGLSESGVKKIMQADDLSLSRLQEITQYLEINIVDLMAHISDPKILDGRFSPEIEQFFVKFPEAFDFYWKLVVERTPLNKIQKAWNLNDAELYRWLRELDQLNLIQWQKGDNIKLPARQMTRWVGRGPLTEKIQRQWAHDLVDDSYVQNTTGASTYRLRYLKISQRTKAELQKAIEELELEFLQRSAREQSLSDEELIDVRLFLTEAAGSFVKRKLK
ncbi:MAG: hypothetical protein COW00_00250 [Bdellovibrio sp. CG12_big_fil_rev_8_21_14_0_65_39_13]|nr:MAG: hypothetical protein COW00_00250 [Bdellovibrio sp. CG12_big_fil_rev_8_21_14_0_65_39_13]PIR33269.1 MAG: hypothetical protein COV37_16985 [Bdellovibrio sp. CG11_big_fil_rev_8_21_14_0_20_39_38]PJB54592.1 MAG: hypothetical protein CO099_00675 [Bdellovibrio sp. CG_4_9_14_3_um_filter_39_7]